VMEIIFEKIIKECESCLEKKVVSDELIDACKNGIIESEKMENESMGYHDIIHALKLFSAGRTCKLILQKCVTELEQSRIKKENPKTLGELAEIMGETANLGVSLSSFFASKSGSCEMNSIRSRTFFLQEMAERIEIIDPIEKRLDLVPIGVRNSFLKNFAEMRQNHSE